MAPPHGTKGDHQEGRNEEDDCERTDEASVPADHYPEREERREKDERALRGEPQPTNHRHDPRPTRVGSARRPQKETEDPEAGDGSVRGSEVGMGEKRRGE